MMKMPVAATVGVFPNPGKLAAGLQEGFPGLGNLPAFIIGLSQAWESATHSCFSFSQAWESLFHS